LALVFIVIPASLLELKDKNLKVEMPILILTSKENDFEEMGIKIIEYQSR
jgi:hypothetical protein